MRAHESDDGHACVREWEEGRKRWKEAVGLGARG